MRNLLLAALLLGPGRPLAWGGQRRVALLAVPAEDFSQWRSLSDLVASYGDLKLTLALTPDMLTPQVRDALAPLTRTGRVELAMRITGDPLLPLAHRHPAAPRPQDSLNRIALCRDKFRSILSTAAAGFVPGGGAVTADMAAVFQAMAVPWVAVGKGPPSLQGSSSPLPEGAPVPNRPVFLPFAAVRGASRLPTGDDLAMTADAARQGAPPSDGTDRLVLDEAGGSVPSGSLMALLRALAQNRPSWLWETASESMPQAAAPAHQDWPGWGADYWSGTPAVAAAWKAYGETAAALMRYQNSGAADLKALESATEALYAAQANRYYRLLAETGAEAAQADRELRQHLMAVYRRLKQPVPGGIHASFMGGQAAAEEAPTDVRVEHGTNWVSFENPAGSLSRAPSGEAAADPWKILSFRVEWDADSVAFLYRMAALDASTSAPRGALGRLVLDTYVDINHVPGAGSSSLLEGRGAFAANRDCWEFALSFGASGGALFRATSDSGPAFLAAVPVSVDAARRSIRAAVPRTLLRGNPLRWGYIVTAFAAQPSSAPRTTSAPAILPEGPLGMLAPLELQKANAASERLKAVRLPGT